MALSSVSYLGDGSNKNFSVTFPYLSKSHVKVFVGGVETFLFTWLTGSSISITTAPANLALVVIQRVTPTTPIVDFVDGSTLTESLLDTSSLQGLYVVEEGRDIADSSMLLDVTDNKYDADSKVIKNVANPVNAQDAATKAWSETAVTASVAQAASSASTATTQAGISTAQALIATTKANEASASASTASLNANTATTKASEANTSAINAASSASTATTQASEANTSAINAAASTNTATTKASEANTSAINAAASAASATSSETNAAASAAGVNLPALTIGDRGKTLLANNAGTGYVFSEGALGNRNILINAGFRINQRGYVSGAVLAAGAYGHDRFKAGASGGDYSFTQLNTNTQITIASGKSLIQVVEDKNVHETAYVLSWEGTAQARVGVNSATPSGSYASSPILITGQTAGTTMSVEFNNGTLGKAQLEKGTIATPFETRSFGQEIDLCYNYTAPARANGRFIATAGTQATSVTLAYKTMRSAPTATIAISGSVVNATISIVNISKNGARLDVVATAAGESFVIDREYLLTAEL